MVVAANVPYALHVLGSTELPTYVKVTLTCPDVGVPSVDVWEMLWPTQSWFASVNVDVGPMTEIDPAAGETTRISSESNR